MKKIPLVVITGPTATGKTGLAIDICERFGGEIVSADSAQVYRYMDIGSAKPTPEEQKRAKHHLIDIIDPDEEFSVALYTEAAHKAIADISKRGKIPVVCGGTGLYVRSLVNDIDFSTVREDPSLRYEFRRMAEEKGNDYLWQKLYEVDQAAANGIHPNNVNRVVRALEYYRTTGVPISEHNEETKLRKSRYDTLELAISYPRDVLYARINKRVDIMLASGLVAEVKKLLEMGYTKDLNSLKAIGYKETIAYIENEINYDELVGLIKKNSRNYAKRQLTWFRRDEDLKLIDAADAVDKAREYVAEFINM